MVIFNSYVKLPEGICNDLWMFSLEIHASQLVAPSHRTSRRGSAQRVTWGCLVVLDITSTNNHTIIYFISPRSRDITDIN